MAYYTGPRAQEPVELDIDLTPPDVGFDIPEPAPEWHLDIPEAPVPEFDLGEPTW